MLSDSSAESSSKNVIVSHGGSTSSTTAVVGIVQTGYDFHWHLQYRRSIQASLTDSPFIGDLLRRKAADIEQKT